MNNILISEPYPELFLGIVSPIGAQIDGVVENLEACLRQNGYEVAHIKVTAKFKELEPFFAADSLSESPLESRYRTHIQFGDALRQKFGDNAFLAYTAMWQIMERRVEITKSHKMQRPERICYILSQFKRREEIDVLRSIYGRQFFQISIFTERSGRVDHLSRKIAKSYGSADHIKFRSDAESLVIQDEAEMDDQFGQRVSEVFHEADYIISTSETKPISEQINRFVDVIFGSNSVSPTRMEYGLYTAKSASLRSLDLSRQVGAAIFSSDGEILAMGSNEVPKAGGGTYWSDDKFDDRDYRRKIDSNFARKKELLRELIEIIAPDRNVLHLLDDPKIKSSQFMDALEYGRMIHAEMSAICDSARTGTSIEGATLYCTTFPCHMCAKHIVAAGIDRVVFLEPYPKSLASDLHSDSIAIQGHSRGEFESFPSVRFEHFFGVSPKRYRDFFERGKRKDEAGIFLDYARPSGSPNLHIKVPVCWVLEEQVFESTLMPALRKIGWTTPTDQKQNNFAKRGRRPKRTTKPT